VIVNQTERCAALYCTGPVVGGKMAKFQSVLLVFAIIVGLFISGAAQTKPRSRDLGVPFDGAPGPLNAITDVRGVEVGHTTLISGDGPLKVGLGPVRTGVTAVLPRG